MPLTRALFRVAQVVIEKAYRNYATLQIAGYGRRYPFFKKKKEKNASFSQSIRKSYT